MSYDATTEIFMNVIKCVFVLIMNRNLFKSLAVAGYVLLCASILMIQPVGVQARETANPNGSPNEFMFLLKTRLNLSDDQETKIKPIIEDSFQKRSEIVSNNSHDRKTMRGQLQELRWSTDMQIGKILTEEQMHEYRKLRQEQKDKAESNDGSHGRNIRYGGVAAHDGLRARVIITIAEFYEGTL